jgi:alpha-L-fucosidase
MKTLEECMITLIKTASGNGNLLFNVGPMMDGRIEQRQVEILKQMGDWLQAYGESIYGTTGGPYTPNEVFSATRKGNKIYVHLFNASEKEISLPLLPGVKVLKASLLKGEPVQIKEVTGKYIITLSDKLPDPICNVLVIEIDKQAENIPVVNTAKKN